MKDDCIFCKIIKGEIPSTKVYEDENVLAFNDINPVAPVHILVVPKKHIENILELQNEDKDMLMDIMESVKKIAKEEGLDKEGFRLVSNCGKNAGQEVMHLHFHIIAGKKLDTKMV